MLINIKKKRFIGILYREKNLTYRIRLVFVLRVFTALEHVLGIFNINI